MKLALCLAASLTTPAHAQWPQQQPYQRPYIQQYQQPYAPPGVGASDPLVQRSIQGMQAPQQRYVACMRTVTGVVCR